jgi:alkanesulfonate monooxygenase SsuD/methylene tetrahydromethanopterin reductase-like flavin-dependent oxidoreductase (luciferase family)
VWVTHIAARDSLTVLAAYATATEHVRLGTGVLPIYSRTPVATAQAAATVDELSGGRMALGVGVSHRVTVENWYGAAIEKPVAEMRAYVAALRAIFRSEDPPDDGPFPTRFQFMGYEVRADLPIYVAGLSPGMLRLAGEVADGVVLWLCNPDYIRDHVVPAVAEGRERAGKSLDGFDVVAAVPASVTDDVESARATMRQDLIPYFSLPFYRKMLERSGFEDDISGFDAEMQKGDPAAATAAISDRFLEALCAIGPPNQAKAGVQRYLEAGATSPNVSPIARSDVEGTLEALSDLAPRS